MNPDEGEVGEKARNKIRDGFVGALLGGATAYVVMNTVDEASWAVVGLIAAASFWVAYRVGRPALEWLLRADDFDPRDAVADYYRPRRTVNSRPVRGAESTWRS